MYVDMNICGGFQHLEDEDGGHNDNLSDDHDKRGNDCSIYIVSARVVGGGDVEGVRRFDNGLG